MKNLISKHGLLWQLALVLLSGLLTCSMLFAAEAQEAAKKEAASKEKPASALTLTPAELKEGNGILQELRTAQQDLGVFWDKILSTEDEDLTLGYAARARTAFKTKVKPANDRLLTWLETARKAHKCEGCQLQGDTFIPAPLPGQVPSTPAPQ